MRNAKSRIWSNAILSIAFGLTGAGTVMLGVLLPVISQRWGLHDNASGFLLFLQFLGSGVGALLTSSNRVRSMLTGYGILVLSGMVLLFAGLYLSFAAFFCWGVGLGMAMTGTSLFISDRSGSDRAQKLEQLNFAWSAGAAAGPVVFAHFLRANDPRFFIVWFQALFALAFLWVLLYERNAARATVLEAAISSEDRPGAGFLLPLVLLSLCCVGVEAALSGWLTTYSHRASPMDASGGALATSFFWLGILLGRLLFSMRLLLVLGRRRVLNVTLWCTAIAVVVLIASHRAGHIDAVAAVAGFSIGPVFPLVLSFLLEESPHGWIFAVAGIGSMLFPWLTGVISAAYGSLRFGLMVPCTAAMLMIVLARAGLRRDRLPRVPELPPA